MKLTRPSLAGAAGIATLLAGFALAPMSVLAGPGHDHDHGEEAPVTGPANAPRRQPDGSVFLPKLSQRQLGVRTVVAQMRSVPQTHQWIGTVVMDPNAGGKVQPTVTGRIEAGPRGLPTLGQRVRKGEVLARVRASTGPLDRAGQTAQAAELRAAVETATKRVTRLEALAGSVPQKEIDAAHAEERSLRERLAAIGGSLEVTEALVAPVSGVIASAHGVAGQIVDAGELLFEIVDPDRLHVEAIAHDAALADAIAHASASTDGGKTAFPLEWVGAGRAMREQTLPVRFRTRAGSAPPLYLGQRLSVIVATRERIDGVPVPTAALVKNPSNQDIVWVHTSAERFVPRPVRHRMLDGATVAVTDGLSPDERVVVQGAPLINQVR